MAADPGVIVEPARALDDDTACGSTIKTDLGTPGSGATANRLTRRQASEVSEANDFVTAS